MAWAWPTTTARWVQETRRTRMQVDLRFPKQDLEGPDDGTPIKGGPTGLLGRSYGPGKMMNERPSKDKHLCLLTLRVNLTTEPPTPAMVGARTSLGGYRECLLV